MTDQLPPGLLPSGASSELAVKQPGGPGTHWVGLMAGWHMFMDSLTNYLGASIITPPFYTLEKSYDNLLTYFYKQAFRPARAGVISE
jgi:hypothetical protein